MAAKDALGLEEEALGLVFEALFGTAQCEHAVLLPPHCATNNSAPGGVMDFRSLSGNKIAAENGLIVS